MNAPLANVIPFPGSPIPKTTISDLLARFAAVEAMENDDVDVRLCFLKATDADTIEIPQLGEHVLTDHSREQFGRALGISWDRFFQGANLGERAVDLNRRLARARGVVRLRTTRAKPDGAPGEGTIRAVVSTDFASIKDTTITNLLSDALHGIEPDARIIRSAITSLSTTFIMKIGEPYKIGGPGKVGEVWGALAVKNSGVGYATLNISLHLVRLSCTNGMYAPIPHPTVLRARHRWIHEGQIREAIEVGLEGIGDRLRRSTHVLAESTHYAIDDIDAEVRAVLKNGKMPVRLVREVMAAYRREPHASRFGVSQALTLAAQNESPEVRLQLEELTGRYLAASAN